MRVHRNAGRFLTFAACLLASTLSTGAAEPSIALILGVKGSPFDDALACGALDTAKKLDSTSISLRPIISPANRRRQWSMR